ncbi:MAG TPA: peptidoglycan-associated lipoprotein Pal [Syntrophales bacterium]|nr:peptidoglycan-associated lipoprotein Pal [Syntrophales bacterium]
MKGKKVLVMLFLFVVACVFVLAEGCAKKAVTKEEATTEQMAPEKQAAPQAEAAPAKPAEQPQVAEGAAAAEAAAAKEASSFLDIHFAFDRYDLRPDEREILSLHAKWLKAHREYVVRIEGNCDERGTVEYNMALGQRRADSAAKYLINLGVDKKRITTISYGKERPLDPGHNEEAWAKNRRDHFTVTLKK